MAYSERAKVLSDLRKALIVMIGAEMDRLSDGKEPRSFADGLHEVVLAVDKIDDEGAGS